MNTENHTRPDIAEIETLLTKFEPHPSQSFHDRMAHAPWNKKAPGAAFGSEIVFQVLRLQRWRFAILPLSVILIIGIGLLVSPSWRAASQNLLRYLLPAPGDQIKITLEAPQRVDIQDYSQPDYFALSLENLEKIVAYPVKSISPLEKRHESSLAFGGAHYDPTFQSVTLRYQASSFSIYFTQQPAGETQEVLRIGASAPIETVIVRGVDGEFVSGGWVAVDATAVIGATPQPASTVELGAVWDPLLPQHTLRWQADGFYFEIILFGEVENPRDLLINLAERVK